MKNFNTWAASFFSWGETPSKTELEGYELAYAAGRNHCKEEVLKILEQNWQGADLSINSCDQHYVDKIKEEL